MLSKSCTQCTLAVSVWLFIETGSCVLSNSTWQINKVASRGFWCQFLGCFLTVGHSYVCHQQREYTRCKPVLDVVAQCLSPVSTCIPRATGCSWVSPAHLPFVAQLPWGQDALHIAACPRNQWLGIAASLYLCCECPAFSPPLMVSCRLFSLWCQI